MDEGGKEEGGINQISPFFSKEKLSWKPHSRSLFRPCWPKWVAWPAATVRPVERKQSAFLTSPVESSE